jgi:HTH-type transcriptional repressor of NAD biosynthesis genes
MGVGKIMSTNKQKPKRIAFVGAESCGKTTLAKFLAEQLQTWLVPEYWRHYWEAKKFGASRATWNTDEFIHVAKTQNDQEDYFASKTPSILVCDTNAFMTSVWHKRYLGFESAEIDRLAKTRSYDLLFFCPANIPFVQDGERDGEMIRPEMSKWIEEKLKLWGVPFHSFSEQESLPKRQSKVLRLVESLTS